MNFTSNYGSEDGGHIYVSKYLLGFWDPENFSEPKFCFPTVGNCARRFQFVYVVIWGPISLRRWYLRDPPLWGSPTTCKCGVATRRKQTADNAISTGVSYWNHENFPKTHTKKKKKEKKTSVKVRPNFSGRTIAFTLWWHIQLLPDVEMTWKWSVVHRRRKTVLIWPFALFGHKIVAI